MTCITVRGHCSPPLGTALAWTQLHWVYWHSASSITSILAWSLHGKHGTSLAGQYTHDTRSIHPIHWHDHCMRVSSLYWRIALPPNRCIASILAWLLSSSTHSKVKELAWFLIEWLAWLLIAKLAYSLHCAVGMILFPPKLVENLCILQWLHTLTAIVCTLL